jgi:hypothetical protein
VAAVDPERESFVNMSETQQAFDAIVRREGLKAALAWRDARYEERLAEQGKVRDALRGHAAGGEGPSAG